MRTDRGNAAVVLIVGVVALGAAVAGALADFGGAAQERTRAQTAADAAALASLDGGQRVAARFAELHGATVVAWTRHGRAVTVMVRLGRATATARATNHP